MVIVFEVINEVFEDIVIESSLYEFFVILKLVYKIVFDVVLVCSDYDFVSGLFFDSDC